MRISVICSSRARRMHLPMCAASRPARVRMRAAVEPALTMPPPEVYDAARIHGLRVRWIVSE